MNASEYDLIVIGGGPAGCMCALTAAEKGLRAAIVESNRNLGRKLRITGKGRCNITNDCEIKELMNNMVHNGKFLYSAFNMFSSRDLINWFERNGLPLKTERGNRVFPVSDNANDVANKLEQLVKKAGITVIKDRIKEIITDEATVTGVIGDKRTYSCAAAAVCAGGASYPLTGSDGSGYELVRKLGHSITDIKPSLVPLESSDDCCSELQGFAPRNVSINVFEDGELVYTDFGEMLFAHFGISGPLVLSASSHLKNPGKSECRIDIDFKPALDIETLDKRILRDFDKYKNREISNALSDLMVSSMVPVVLDMCGIPGDIKVNSVTREQRRAIAALLKAFPVHITGTRPIDEAIITSGGVSVKEINPRTMESKIIKHLFFAGEIIDVDAYTGGFNLQIAWSTGFTAGTGAERVLNG